MTDETKNEAPEEINESAEDVVASENAEAVESTEAVEGELETSEEVSQSAELEAALAEVAKLKDQMVREQAETQNIRKRVQRDVENARKFALEKFVAELLPIMDNLERAIGSAGDDEATKPVLEGIELTYKTFLDTLAKFNVTQVNPVGEPFDANFHQAMTMVPNPDMEPNSVMDVMQKGYTLNDRLVRPAMVVVSKAP
ncbi:MAG: nucleotide exchange factor GrpE [Pseudomonadales bacterium]|nr:nucleotide exchange factor GrpE [Pseudomonadales bacterium]